MRGALGIVEPVVQLAFPSEDCGLFEFVDHAGVESELDSHPHVEKLVDHETNFTVTSRIDEDLDLADLVRPVVHFPRRLSTPLLLTVQYLCVRLCQELAQFRQ